jgi:prepilin-type N-terminal cleavage/methylation domain-containing protein
MPTKPKSTNNKQSGFTLVELLIIIGIIGLLASIILTALGTVRSKARDARRKSEMIQIQKALELYYAQNNEYPITPIGDFFYGKRCIVNGPDWIPGLAPNFLGSLPTDPLDPSGTGFLSCAGYSYRSDGQNYKLRAMRVGSIGPESMPSAGEPFYNPPEPLTSWMVCSAGSITACNTWAGIGSGGAP